MKQIPTLQNSLYIILLQQQYKKWYSITHSDYLDVLVFAARIGIAIRFVLFFFFGGTLFRLYLFIPLGEWLDPLEAEILPV